MKMRPVDYAAMRDAIEYRFRGEFMAWKNRYKVDGLSDMRFRWDCLHISRFDVSRLYAYLNDSHIDTALRHVVNELSEGLC
jgi:hypothetical protein